MSEKGNKILYMVLSLLLAAVFWLYVDDNTMSRDFTNVPVDFIGAEDTLPSRGLMLAEGEDATVNLKLRGSRSVISSLRPGDVRVQVNLTNINAAGPYSLTYTLQYPDNVNSSDITVEQRSRSSITVQVTSLYSREIPVNVSVVGTVDDPYLYKAEGVSKEPAVLTVSGLREGVDQVASARVVVDITGASNTIQQEFSYELLDSEGNVLEDANVRVSDQRVNVTVPIYMTKALPLVVRYKESPGSRKANAECRLEPDTVTVAGDPLSLATLEEIVLGEVDLSAYLTDMEENPLEIKLPAGCENISGYKTTNLSIRFRGLTTRSFTVTNIRHVGASERQRFDLIAPSVDVVLRGPAEDLEQVTEEDIRIVVDLTEIASDGTVTLPATVLVDGYSEVGAIGSPTVTGKIISS